VEVQTEKAVQNKDNERGDDSLGERHGSNERQEQDEGIWWRWVTIAGGCTVAVDGIKERTVTNA
jgi:hypothetical protein